MNGFYWIYLVMFAFLLAYHKSECKETKVRLYYAACGFLILMFAMQDYSVSGDNDEYMLQYGIIRDLPISEFLNHKFELGFVIINKLLANTFQSDRVLFVVMSVLVLVPFCVWMERESSHPMMALMSFVAVGIYFHAVVLWRQLCAMGILCFSLRYIRERKLLPFLGTVLLAMLFHKAAAVFLPLYVAYRLPVNKWLLIGAGVLCTAMAVLGGPIMRFINTYIYSYEEYFFGLDGGFTMLAVLWIFTLLVWWLMQHRLQEPKIKLLFLMMLVSAMIQPVSFTFSNWCRIVLFYRLAMVMLIPELYETLFLHRENNKLLALLQKRMPKLYGFVNRNFEKKWFRGAVQTAMFTVLFAWYASELDGAYYILAPVI